MRGKPAEDRHLLELLDPVAEAAGYDIVRLRMMGGQARRTLKGQSGTVTSVACSPEGKRLLSGSEDNVLKVWETQTTPELLLPRR